jgi:hypothetical protein
MYFIDHYRKVYKEWRQRNPDVWTNMDAKKLKPKELYYEEQKD